MRVRPCVTSTPGPRGPPLGTVVIVTTGSAEVGRPPMVLTVAADEVLSTVCGGAAGGAAVGAGGRGVARAVTTL
jgi:hypothetical protein